MPKIVTLTPNPAIDLSTAVERVVPSLKLRCAQPRRDPGGGGVNVARVVKRLGGNVEAILPVGGFTGELLRRLLEKEGISGCLIKAEADTREDFSVIESSTGSQYRFVLPGEPLRESEWRGGVLARPSPQTLKVGVSGSRAPRGAEYL
jgi:6-phosphofructokinase 2